MAETRTCPECGTKWVSADSQNTWTCDVCGAEIPVPGKGIVRSPKCGKERWAGYGPCANCEWPPREGDEDAERD